MIYNLYFHALNQIPGPKLWAATRLTYISSLVRGNIVHDVKRIHQKYGPIVRVAPDDISFATEEAWQEVLGARPGQKQCVKDLVFFTPPPGQHHNIVSVPDIEVHARHRRALNPAFTPSALKAQEPIVESYVDLLISRLTKRVVINKASNNEAVVNMTDWYTFTAFDIIGDLGFGEPFHCLRDSVLHSWIELIFGFIKTSAYAAASRYYPWLSFLINKYFIPKRLLKMSQDHYQLAVSKVHRRINLEKQRPDFMTPVLQQGILPPGQEGKGMTLPEIESTFAILIVAGSETLSTCLSGITTYLLRNPSIFETLAAEVLSTFSSASQIRIAALNDLPYLNAIIQEGLRVCPPLSSGILRVAPKGGTTICGLHIPEGTHVCVHITSINMSPSLFHKPEEFIPERWLPETRLPPEYANDRLSAVRSFGAGPRACIGKQLALAQMRLMLARLAWTFEMGIPEGYGEVLDWQRLKTYVVLEKEAVWVKLRQRGKCVNEGGKLS